MWQHNVWCVCMAFRVERYVVEVICVMGQHNVSCVRVVFCVERYVVEVICGNVAT